MSKVLLAALTSAALLGLSGCADMQSQSEAMPAAAHATISAEAQSALSAAQADVKEAKAKFALWTTAENALKSAEAAAEKGDSAMVIKEAKWASELTRKGLAQLDYPVLKIGD
jgi:hypothetical protein